MSLSFLLGQYFVIRAPTANSLNHSITHSPSACISPRTDAGLVRHVAALLSYRPVTFQATAGHGHAIYHTNVMMCVGGKFATVCLESIPDPTERAAVVNSLTATRHELVAISRAQVERFAGNMLTLQPASGGRELLVRRALSRA